MRLSRIEQIIILQAADTHPGPLADWLKKWIDAQNNVGSGGTFRIDRIPIPEPVAVEPEAPRHPNIQIHGATGGRIYSTKDEREELREKRKRLLAAVDVESLPAWQRKAVKKHIDAKVTKILETDRYADSEECWIGDHPMKGWEADDFYLWRIEGTWESGKDLGKWGCEECARLVFRTHPEAQIYAL